MATGLTVITWLWGHKYTREHADRLRDQVADNLTIPHRFIVIDDIEPLCAAVGGWMRPNRKCLRRVILFADEMRGLLGDTILQLDVDQIVTGNIDHLITDDDFKIWRSPSIGVRGYAYNSSVMLMRTGAIDHIWRAVKSDPVAALDAARSRGWTGSDQAVIGDFVDMMVPTYGREDGIVPASETADGLPSDARIVSFYGAGSDPATCGHEWVRRYW